MRFVDDIGFAIGWVSANPTFMHRTSHAVVAGGRVWVIDPVDDEEAFERVAKLGDPVAVVQLLDRHGRDCSRVAQRLGVPHHVVPDGALPGAPFEVVPVLRRSFWRETALWFPEHRTLVCADVLGTAPYFRAPSERIGVSPLLRFTPPRVLLRYEPEHVLVGHGEGVHENATQAVRDAVLHARRRTPSWFVEAIRSTIRR